MAEAQDAQGRRFLAVGGAVRSGLTIGDQAADLGGADIERGDDAALVRRRRLRRPCTGSSTTVINPRYTHLLRWLTLSLPSRFPCAAASATADHDAAGNPEIDRLDALRQKPLRPIELVRPSPAPAPTPFSGSATVTPLSR